MILEKVYTDFSKKLENKEQTREIFVAWDVFVDSAVSRPKLPRGK